MPFMKTDMIEEARELQEIFKDDLETKEMFHDYELKHIEAERILEEELALRNRLVEYRKSRNITQKDIEIRSGMTQQAISRLEVSKDVAPNLKSLIRYSEAIGCVLIPKDKKSINQGLEM